ncbi:MAG: hypothetical protein RL456_3392, partial [Pseudomonadota bacterium]
SAAAADAADAALAQPASSADIRRRASGAGAEAGRSGTSAEAEAGDAGRVNTDLARLPANDMLVMLGVQIDLSGFTQERAALLQWGEAANHSRGTEADARQEGPREDRPALQWSTEMAVRAGSVALSLGMLFWATRASGLIASLMVASPPWRRFDPLPVLHAGGSRAVPQPEEGTEAQWLETDISGALAGLAEDLLDHRR